MSFRLRVTLLVAAAVAFAAIGAAAVMYVLVQDQLIRQVDNTLADAAIGARGVAQARPGAAERFISGTPRELLITGRREVFAQVVDANGTIVRGDLGLQAPGLVTPSVRDVARGTRELFYTTMTIGDERIRVLVVPFGNGQALEIARPLDEIDAVLGRARFVLLALAALAALSAAGLSLLITRAALAPVRRLTNTVEEVSRTRDLSRRVALTRHDELGRLAASFDAMLAQLEASLRSQRQLVADASHELRTPLTALRTNLELLARGEVEPAAEREKMLRDILSQIDRLTRLVGDLIDLARDEESPHTPEDVRLDELVTDAVTDARMRFPRVRFVVNAEPSVVRGVPGRIARAVTNLLDNAGKFSPDGALVEVSVAEGEIAVRDHGPGIAPEHATHVFDRFWRAPTARDKPGSGLGLAIVRDVANAHGGSVVVERPTDGGARFRLRLA